MIRSFWNPALVMIAVLICSVLGGCLGLGEGSQPTQYYLLSGIEEGQANVQGAPLDTEVVLQVGPVKLPKYLDRPQIVTHSGENELLLAEFDYWAEPLEENISRVLAKNLTQLVPTDRIILYPLEAPESETYQIKVDILNFSGQFGGEVHLDARWMVGGKGGKAIVPIKKSAFSEPTDKESYAATVAALNRTLEKLSREIAGNIRPHLIK